MSAPAQVHALATAWSAWVPTSSPTGTWLACTLVATLMTCLLAACCTPRHWWQRPTLLGGALLVGSSWMLAQLLLAAGAHLAASAALANRTLRPEAAQALASPPGTLLPTSLQTTPNPTTAARFEAGQAFRVWQRLNLRQEPGVNGQYLTTLPAGSMVELTGQRQGDWWHIKSSTQHGWVNSLWLRQASSP